MPTTARTNRFAAPCTRCGGSVPEGLGLLDRDASGKWVVSHSDACPPLPAPAPAATPPALPDVPQGRYAVTDPTGKNDLRFYRVDKPTSGRWAGYTFVKRLIGGDRADRVGRDEAAAVLSDIEDFGVHEAGMLYAQEFGRCYKCGLTLTDDDSRAAGMGPWCRKKGH
jgi:Family of unknown function (DUF6011)